MKQLRIAALGVLLAVSATSTVAYARGHAHVGVYFGGPWVWPGYYYPPPYAPGYYVYPPAAPIVTAPPAYVEQNPPPAESNDEAEGYWYYCRKPNGYYPYVRQCPDGWEQVPPRPADSR